ncbi:MAG: hypothetical protein J5J00_01825 [Deltaproteobacteria bacterium]|nr:hypothetical protein [Deltaproteobacteria bacterium]
MSKGALKLVSALIILAQLCGCYTVQYRVKNQAGSTYKHSYWNQYFFWGIAPANNVHKFSELCHGGNLIAAESEVTPLNFFSAMFSAGLSSSATLEATCVSPSGSAK